MGNRHYKPPRGAERLLLHSLGLDEYKHEPYRNYFVAGPRHHAAAELADLVARGLMATREPEPGWLPPGSVVYTVTASGREVALRLHRGAFAKLTRGQKRYRAYLEVADVWDIDFGEWLRRGCPGGA